MVTQIASDIEIIVMQWLDKRKIQYVFQAAIAGGFFELGGAVVDFLLEDMMMAWRVHGEYWHRGVAPEARDMVQKELLAGLGYTTVDIWGDDLLDPAKREGVLLKALRGEEALR